MRAKSESAQPFMATVAYAETFHGGVSFSGIGRAGLRWGNGGNCPGPPAARGPPVMKFICFK